MSTRVDSAVLAAIEAYASSRRITRSFAVHELIEAGLEALSERDAA